MVFCLLEFRNLWRFRNLFRLKDQLFPHGEFYSTHRFQRISLSKKEVLDFSSPLSRVSFFSLENIFLNKLILKIQGFRFQVPSCLLGCATFSKFNLAFLPLKKGKVALKLPLGRFQRRKGSAKIRKATFAKKWLFLNILSWLFFVQPVVYKFWSHDSFSKCISSCFWRFNHFYCFG